MIRVGYQGEPGAFSEMAVMQRLPHAQAIPFRDFDMVVAALENNAVDYAMLPIENSIAGVVEGTRDIFQRADFIAHDELWLPIHHCLMALPHATLDDLVHVLSHPVALAQCTKFLERYPTLRPLPWYDTAGAALYISGNHDPTMGAIASAAAAERYDLTILAHNVEDRSDNRTRFVVLGKGIASEKPQRSEDR